MTKALVRRVYQCIVTMLPWIELQISKEKAQNFKRCEYKSKQYFREGLIKGVFMQFVPA